MFFFLIKKPAKCGLFFAGSRLQGSNPIKRKNAPNQPPTKEEGNPVRLTEDLIKLHEFYKIFFREITSILEKD